MIGLPCGEKTITVS